jgi:hypothetical protein
MNKIEVEDLNEALSKRMGEHSIAELITTNKKSGKQKVELWYITTDDLKLLEVLVFFDGQYPLWKDYTCSCCWDMMLKKYSIKIKNIKEN